MQGNGVYAFLLKCALSVYYTSGTVLGTRSMVVNKRGLLTHCGILDVEVKPDCFLWWPFLTSSLLASGWSVSVGLHGRALRGTHKRGEGSHCKIHLEHLSCSLERFSGAGLMHVLSTTKKSVLMTSARRRHLEHAEGGRQSNTCGEL